MSQSEICESRQGNVYIKHEDNGKQITYIFVNGYKNDKKEQLRFEWFESTKDFPVNRIFIVGTKSLWYHDCMDYIVPCVKPLIEGKRALTIGASMGGYGALLLAHHLGCDSITFAPQTIITRSFLRLDPRWEDALIRVNDMTRHPEWLDLEFVQGEQHHIYFSNLVPLDVAHASRMKCKLFPVTHGSHNIAGKLKNEGTLRQILLDRLKTLGGNHAGQADKNKIWRKGHNSKRSEGQGNDDGKGQEAGAAS